MANVNEPRFVSFPKELITGVLSDDASPDVVAESLVAAGVAAENVQFLQGEAGLDILNPEGDHGPLGQRLRRKVEHLTFEGEILAQVAKQLEDGHTVVGVFGVKKEDEQRLRDVCRNSGVRDIHYIGTLGID